MLEPSTLVYPTADEIDSFHDAIITTVGGLPGVRLESGARAITGRIESNILYSEFNHIAEVAALYADGHRERPRL